jgi:hypothetical protein
MFATPDTIEKLTATFDRTDETPEEITALLDVSRKLLRGSTAHYEFAAVGSEKSL